MGDVSEPLLALMHNPHEVAINGHRIAVIKRDGFHNFTTVARLPHRGKSDPVAATTKTKKDQ